MATRRILAYQSSYGFETLPATPAPVGTDTTDPTKPPVYPAKFLKDVAAFGQYIHPVHGWNLDIDGNRMDKWCAAFSKMKNDGVKVPIYTSHRGSTENCLGYCSDIFRGGPEAMKNHPELAALPANKAPVDPNRLYAIHEFPDGTGVALANRVGQVSVLIDKNYKPGNGKNYGEAVRHVAVTPEPIVRGQNEFVGLSAGNCGMTDDDWDSDGVFVLAVDEGRDGKPGTRGTKSMLTPTELTAIKSQFPEADQATITAENGVDKLCARLLGLSNEMATTRERFEMDEDVAGELGAAHEIRLSALVSTGKLSPAAAKALKPVLLGDDKNPNIYALSRKATGTPVSLAHAVLDAIEQNEIVPLGERTHGQRGMELSRLTAEQEADKKMVDEEFAKAANRGRKSK